jgi:hypothetical protein
MLACICQGPNTAPSYQRRQTSPCPSPPAPPRGARSAGHVCKWPLADEGAVPAEVRFWPKADLPAACPDVAFRVKQTCRLGLGMSANDQCRTLGLIRF